MLIKNKYIFLDFFSLFNTLIFIYLSKYETIKTHACAFFTLIVLAIAGVNCNFEYISLYKNPVNSLHLY